MNRAGAIARLEAAGFVARERAGRTWLRFPDGHDSEIVAADAPIDADALLALAACRAAVLAWVRDSVGRAGWGMRGAAIGKDSLSSSFDLGWALTERLRDETAEAVAGAMLSGWAAYFGAFDPSRPLQSPPPDTDALWRAHERASARAFGEDPDAVDDDEDEEEVEPLLVLRSRSVPSPERRAAAIAAVAPLSDADMDRWADDVLAMLRRDVGANVDVSCLLERIWWTGDGDWLDAPTLAAAYRAALAADPWHTPAARGLLALGTPDAMPLALAAWDSWQSAGPYDADSYGFDVLASWLHRERPLARDFVLDGGHVRSDGRAFRGGFANALHAIREGLEEDLLTFTTSVEARACHRAHWRLLEQLNWAGPDAAIAVLDVDEAAQLRSAGVALVRTDKVDDYDGEWTLALAADCGWPDVALAVLEDDRDAFLAGDGDASDVTGRLPEALLALSALAPGPACAELARLAQARIRRRSALTRLTDNQAIAIAWWRCRPRR